MDTKVTNDLAIENLRGFFDDLLHIYESEELCSLLKINPKDFTALIKAETNNFHDNDPIFSKLGVSPRRLMEGNADIGCVVLKLNGHNNYAPYRFKEGSLSKKAVTQSIIALTTKLHSKELADQIKLHFQIGDDYLHKTLLSQPVSTFLNKEILLFLEQYNLKSFDIGTHLITQAQHNNQLFKGLKISQMYEKVVEEVVSKVDNSHNYQLRQLTGSKVIFRKTYSEELVDQMGGVLPDINMDNQYTLGYGAAVPYFECKKILPASYRKVSSDAVDFEFQFTV